MNPAPSQSDPARHVPRVSPLLWRWFGWYAQRFLRKSFHAVRLDNGGTAPTAIPRGVPLIVYSNHPSWWDPMVAIFLARHWFPDRRHYWPIDADMLRKYRFFARLGFFGVEQGHARGGATFLRTARRALAQDDACLWVTAEGEFADVRRRPLRLRPGLAHLAHRLERAVILPVCVEYAFWTERTPEVLLRIGRPIEVRAPSPGIDAWHRLLEDRLEENMNALAASAMPRDAAAFTTMLGGASGTSRTYDAWRWFRAALAGRRFDPAHAPETPASQTGARQP